MGLPVHNFEGTSNAHNLGLGGGDCSDKAIVHGQRDRYDA